jgi:hypothetical protein
MNGKALPAPWIWWDTFGLPAVSTTPQDVNAGPIFSNQQAQQVCPDVCTKANANWNGQWKTTVPSRCRSAVASRGDRQLKRAHLGVELGPKDLAARSQPVQQSGHHPLALENLLPFAEGQVAGRWSPASCVFQKRIID